LRGFFFFLFSFSLFVIGIVKINLAILLWGSAFSLVSLYTLIGSVLLRGTLGWFFKGGRGKIEVTLPPKGLFIGEDGHIVVKLKMPRFLLPGFGYTLYVRLSFSEERNLELFHPVKPGESEVSLGFTPEKRGSYRAERLSLLCEDYLGLSGLGRDFEFNGSVRVYPSVSGRSEFLPKIEGGGERDEYTRKRKRSDELLEVRKYFPGDDLRKLNWNVFAHTGELFVRIGEDTLQMKSNILVVLDCTMKDETLERVVGVRGGGGSSVFGRGKRGYLKMARVIADDYLDELVRLAGGVILSFLNRGVEISLWIVADSKMAGGGRGKKSIVHLNPKNREELLDILCAVYWDESGESIEKINLPRMRGMHGVIFSTPFSLVLDSIIDRMREQRWRVSLFFKGIEEPQEAEGFDFRELLFVSAETNADVKGEREAEVIRRMKSAIERVFDSYRSSKRVNEVDLR